MFLSVSCVVWGLSGRCLGLSRDFLGSGGLSGGCLGIVCRLSGGCLGLCGGCLGVVGVAYTLPPETHVVLGWLIGAKNTCWGGLLVPETHVGMAYCLKKDMLGWLLGARNTCWGWLIGPWEHLLGWLIGRPATRLLAPPLFSAQISSSGPSNHTSKHVFQNTNNTPKHMFQGTNNTPKPSSRVPTIRLNRVLGY